MRAKNPSGAAAERKRPAVPVRQTRSLTVKDFMTSDVESCNETTDLAAAAMIMWRRDCGFVPVVDTVTKKVIGVITDRDICMAVATKGRRASEIHVGDVMVGAPHTCVPSDSVHRALDVMREKRVRRLPVVDPQGALTGILSLNDIVLHSRSAREAVFSDVNPEEILETLRGISVHLQPA